MNQGRLHHQGLNIADGAVPVGDEIRTWRAAFLTREMLLEAPENMDEREQAHYIDILIRTLKRHINGVSNPRVPYIVYSCIIIHNEMVRQSLPVQIQTFRDRCFVIEDEILKAAKNNLPAEQVVLITEPLHLGSRLREIISYADMKWEAELELFNRLRKKGGKPELFYPKEFGRFKRANAWINLYTSGEVTLNSMPHIPPGWAYPKDIVTTWDSKDGDEGDDDMDIEQEDVPIQKKRPRASTGSELGGDKVSQPSSTQHVDKMDDKRQQKRVRVEIEEEIPSTVNTRATGRGQSTRPDVEEGPSTLASPNKLPNVSGRPKDKVTGSEDGNEAGSETRSGHASDRSDGDKDEEVANEVSKVADTKRSNLPAFFKQITNVELGSVKAVFSPDEDDDVAVKEKWDENSRVPPKEFFSQRPFLKFIFEEQFAPAACDACIKAHVPCIINLGHFYGCYSCKSRQTGCSLCPKASGVQVKPKEWCRWLTIIHHIVTFLKLRSGEGPIDVIPDYANVVFPRFPKRLSAFFSRTMTASEVKGRWAMLEKEAEKMFYWPVPHQRLRALADKRPVGTLWPFLGDSKRVKKLIVDTFRQIEDRTISRAWAIGYADTYAPTENGKKGKKKVEKKPKVVSSRKVVEKKVKEDAKGRQDDKKTSPKETRPRGSKRQLSPVPSRTSEDEERMSVYEEKSRKAVDASSTMEMDIDDGSPPPPAGNRATQSKNKGKGKAKEVVVDTEESEGEGSGTESSSSEGGSAGYWHEKIYQPLIKTLRSRLGDLESSFDTASTLDEQHREQTSAVKQKLEDLIANWGHFRAAENRRVERFKAQVANLTDQLDIQIEMARKHELSLQKLSDDIASQNSAIQDIRDTIKSNMASVSPSMSSQDVSNFAQQITDSILAVVRKEMQPLESIAMSLTSRRGESTDNSSTGDPITTGAMDDGRAGNRPRTPSIVQPPPGSPSATSDHRTSRRDNAPRSPVTGDPSSPPPFDNEDNEADEVSSLPAPSVTVASTRSSDSDEGDVAQGSGNHAPLSNDAGDITMSVPDV
ncbi:hypothetical protein QCA50_016962 [Cerrena zonata]|uniref:RING-type domain-containing protein n=1 Tax=Cerrena zonata TaxID=2478898 RepID=A0AAW0FHE4_9APHY